MNRFALTLLLGAVTLSPVFAQIPRQQSAIESYRRQDWTGKGTYHRLGLIREQDRTLSSATEAEEVAAEEVTATGISSSVSAAEGKKAVVGEEETTEAPTFFETLNEYVSLEGHANTMFFGSTNILNTETDPIQAGQFAEFLGASIDLKFREWKLATGFDQAWFRFYDRDLATGDFNTSTIRQALSYERFLFNDKFSATVSPNWQYTALQNRSSGKIFFQQWTYGLNNEFSWFATDWMIPTFSFNFSYLDADVPLAVADKFKYDFNLGITFIPFKDVKLFVSPSLQFSTESNVGIRRYDNAWTPTLAVTYQPLDFLAVDFVGSYTDSRSTLDGASFTAFSGTIFVRAFYRW